VVTRGTGSTHLTRRAAHLPRSGVAAHAASADAMGMRAARILITAAALFLVLETAAGAASDRRSSRVTGERQARAQGDPLSARAVSDLAAFTDWLATGPRRGKGFIGEVGWPGATRTGGDSRWNGLAAEWYRRARTAKLWVAAWAAGDFWAPSYKLLAYRWSRLEGGTPNPQAAVIEAQPLSRLRGINLAGAEFAAPVSEPTSRFSNANRGVHGREYTYPSRELMEYVSGRGISFIRVPVRWERLQPRLGRPLDADEALRLRRCVADAEAAGLAVIVDVHNYGAYYVASSDRSGLRRPIGSRDVPIAHFADLWARLSALLKHDGTVLGYGLMNEPVGMRGAGAWEAASRAAVRAIRANRDQRRIFVQSYFWGGARQFSQYHARGPWIADGNVWYEAHQYFDRDSSARYLASYEAEARAAAARAGG
jgi:Cellulase (glycosyl hydrolase family 5)